MRLSSLIDSEADLRVRLEELAIVLAYDLGKRLQFTRNLLMEGLQRRS